MSLVGVLLAFLKARDLNGGVSVALTLFGVATVIISWLLVHTLFTLRYAHLYYRAEPGGIDFKTGDDHPDYGDFAYVAFTVGMTFQVSDTDVTDPMIRRTVLRHALLAFVFGTIIVAMSINIIAGLVR